MIQAAETAKAITMRVNETQGSLLSAHRAPEA